MICESIGCSEKAVFRCFWPGQTLVQCDTHKRALLNVGKAMGLEVAFEFVDQEAYEASKESP